MNLMTIREVAAQLRIARGTVYVLMERFPDFPKPIHIGPQSPRWLPNELTAWIEAQRTVTQ